MTSSTLTRRALGLGATGALLLRALPAAAQRSTAGSYEITQARYGTAYRNVDVTEILRAQAGSGRAFWVSNSLMGGDPDEGRPKALRVYARGADGATRVFEYAEGDTVDGSQFTGWRGGQWGQAGGDSDWHGGGNTGGGPGDLGEYRIEQAMYGAGRRSVDVTAQLRDLARSDQRFRVENELFGVDPAVNQAKTLRIVARGPRGESRTFDYAEGSVVDGGQFAGWSGGGWGTGPGGGLARINIVRAVYGVGRRQADVTARLRELSRNGRIDIEVNNDTLGGDPAPDRPKALSLTYTLGGRGPQQVTVAEWQRLRLP